MSLAEDDDVVQTLATDGHDDAFDVGILPGGAWRRAHDVNPNASTVRPNAASKVASPSWRRNRAVASSGKDSRSCWRVYAEDGCRVTSTCRIRRRSWARTTKTNRIRQVSVGTAKKSTAIVEPRWFLRNVRQL